MSTNEPTFDRFGPNAGLVEDEYRAYLENPASTTAEWRQFFADNGLANGGPSHGNGATTGNGNGARSAATAVLDVIDVPVTPTPAPAPAPAPVAAAPAPAAPAPVPATPAPAPAPAVTTAAPARPAVPGAPVLAGDELVPLRGAAKAIASNMEASLTVPTATSVREVPAKLLEVNRLIANNHLKRERRGKISFTHLVAWAIVRSVEAVPGMRNGYAVIDGEATVVRHHGVNLGIAVDLERPDGTRTLLVPVIKGADTLDFAGFHAAYEAAVERARSGKLTADDLAGTTITITNPGTLGTVHSVPRLMPGQSVIVGVGAIGYPAAFEGSDPTALASMGMGKTIALTSTYDHRVIQGAESGRFLAEVHRRLLGEDTFYEGVFAALDVPYEPARWVRDVNPVDEQRARADKQSHVFQLINMYRVRGHLIADIDPLSLRPRTHPELDPNFWGLTIWDLDREFLTGGLAGRPTMTLRDILGVLRDAYSRSIGVEYMHIQEPEEKTWIQQHVEGVPTTATPADQRRILERLIAAEVFERFLHTRYLGHKRFGLDGAETLIPMLDGLLSAAADDQMAHVVLGMSHRGRLNVLGNVIGKSYGQIFREFEGNLDPSATQGTGDVKYHMGATGKHASPAGHEVVLRLAANPSHLEAVDPVVEGMARALAEEYGDDGPASVLAVLLHGDAAFAGQGVVAETLNLSGLPGYHVGGTVHIVVNNQVGFTTSAVDARSSIYATDVAKMVQAPVFHVNGDDPEACLRVARLAFAYRQRFRKDVVIDMLCYRRHGHNESDEPSYTQPKMYARIEQMPSVRELYTQRLVDRGDLTDEEAEASSEAFKELMESAFTDSHQTSTPSTSVRGYAPREPRYAIPTGVDRDTLASIAKIVSTVPEGFTIHPKLVKLVTGREQQFQTDHVDWALAEHLAYGSLLLEGHSVRLAGQDTQRGTFSHRHAVLVDHETEVEYIPLAHLSDSQARFSIYDSLLSEYAALGFEYGYSVVAHNSLVVWEAQFGDFANGAQIILDQFISAALSKWGQRSGLTMLLPHGYEGQGPEHSSARIERYVELCADDNWRVIYPTTAGQMFHALRRQIHAPMRKPLVVFTPKKYLRMPQTRSTVAEVAEGSFVEVLDDPRVADPAAVKRVVFCTGKVGHELLDRRDQLGAPAAVVRLEQLYPFREDLIAQTLDRYPAATEVLWCQEEPENMGAWSWIDWRLHSIVAPKRTLDYVARAESAAPAGGSATIHEAEQEELLNRAFSGL